MRFLTTLLAVALIGNLAAPAQAVIGTATAPSRTHANLPKLDPPRFVASYPRPPLIAASLSSDVTPPGRVSTCANIAALRGLGARQLGADDAAQHRVLAVTFLMCMSGKAL